MVDNLLNFWVPLTDNKKPMPISPRKVDGEVEGFLLEIKLGFAFP